MGPPSFYLTDWQKHPRPGRRGSDPPYNPRGNRGLPGAAHLLPPPAHAIDGTPEPSPPIYGARPYSNDGWNSHENSGYNDRGSYHTSEPRHLEPPRAQEIQHYNQNHQSPSGAYQYPNPTAAPVLPVPYCPPAGYAQPSVPQYGPSNYRNRASPYRGRSHEFPTSSRPYPGPSAIEGGSVPRINHHHQESGPRDIHYSPIQEGRQAAHNERRNGNEWMGQQFQPPPPPVPLPESTFYTSSAMGFPDQGYR